ncbi:YrhB domain-containing protein [Streptomyces sp. NPDC058008]|uniref:YrhB domain-containing protein n=1 Tax=Streptomyces sp. NPDC058008 TaxID=3346303 RepID=UPI0036EB179C
MLPDVIDREFAVRAAQEDLDRRYSGQLVVSGTEEHELVWIVYYQSAEYLRTGDLSHMLGGNGPYLVDLVDGGLHQIGPVSYVTGAWEVDYRSRIRKMVTWTAVDDLHDEIRQTAVARGRIIAMHLLRQRVGQTSRPHVGQGHAAALRRRSTSPSSWRPRSSRARCSRRRCSSRARGSRRGCRGHAQGFQKRGARGCRRLGARSATRQGREVRVAGGGSGWGSCGRSPGSRPWTFGRTCCRPASVLASRGWTGRGCSSCGSWRCRG